MGNSSDPLSPLKSANLLDINELADSPLKNGAQSGQQFPSLYDTLGVRCQGKSPVYYLSEWICSGIYNPHPFSSQTVPRKRFR